MTGSVNKVILIGNVGAPNLKSAGPKMVKPDRQSAHRYIGKLA